MARDVLNGLIEIQDRLHKNHGNINASEIILDESGHAKVNYLIDFD